MHILESIPAAIITDLQGIIKDWLAAAERIFGYDKQEIAGKNLELLVYAKDKLDLIISLANKNYI